MEDKKEDNGNPIYKWTDVICSIAIEHFLDAIEENRRLVDTGLYTKVEFSELCDFTHFFYTDYAGRFLWCKSHNVIEYRGRSEWSSWWYDSPVDHILTVYGNNDIDVKGYKDKKHVLELHFSGLNSWDDYKREVTDKYHLLDNNPTFLGRRDTKTGENWIGDGSGLIGPVKKWVLADELLETLMSSKTCMTFTGHAC